MIFVFLFLTNFTLMINSRSIYISTNEPRKSLTFIGDKVLILLLLCLLYVLLQCLAALLLWHMTTNVGLFSYVMEVRVQSWCQWAKSRCLGLFSFWRCWGRICFLVFPVFWGLPLLWLVALHHWLLPSAHLLLLHLSSLPRIGILVTTLGPLK